MNHSPTTKRPRTMAAGSTWFDELSGSAPTPSALTDTRRGLRLRRFSDLGPVLDDPSLDVGGIPDLTHAQLVSRLREIRPGEQLLDTLAAQAAESLPDLSGPHQVMHGRQHRNKTSGHLTSGQGRSRISHVTSPPQEMEKPKRGRWWQRDTPPGLKEFRHWSCFAHKSYWLTCKQYDALLERSGDRCEMCLRWHAENTYSGIPHIDHDHARGQWAVRGLLCSRCNLHFDRDVIAGNQRNRYLANAWYISELKRLGVPLAVPDEPPVGSEVIDVADRHRIRHESGWYPINGNSWLNRGRPWTWLDWVRQVGPHNLNVIRSTA